MDWATLFGGVTAGVSGVLEDVLPVAVGVFVLLAGVTIAIGIFRKVGVKR